METDDNSSSKWLLSWQENNLLLKQLMLAVNNTAMWTQMARTVTNNLRKITFEAPPQVAWQRQGG